MTLAFLTASVFCTDAVSQVPGTPDQSVLYLAMIYSTPLGRYYHGEILRLKTGFRKASKTL
jgi:hypothetical protein